MAQRLALGAPAGLQGLLLDMDGVLYRGAWPLPGLVAFFRFLEARAIRYLLVTNNASTMPVGYADKLAQMGVVVSPASVLTAGTVTLRYLQERYPAGTRLYAVCMPALRDLLLTGTGYRWDPHRPRVVISSGDYGVTYAKLRHACLAIRAGADWLATNLDAALPTEAGLVPSAGALVAALAAATGRSPLGLGKPDAAMVQQALARLDLPAAAVGMVGDRLDTDILGGLRGGLTTFLVLTGATTREDVARSRIRPHHVVANLPALMRMLRQAPHPERNG